ncbi:unnamed protein product [Colias eurytheme]|nr:unnamed protein product [Colias eurytheme]
MKVVDRNFSEVLIYDKELRRTNAVFQDVFNVVISNVTRSSDLSLFDSVKLVHDGSLSIYYSLPNSFPTYNLLNNNSFCIDFIEDDSTHNLTPNFWELEADSSDEPVWRNYYIITALLISSIFLLLVIIVYSIIPELRNTPGKILMAYIISLLGAFLSLAITRIILTNTNPTPEFCFGCNFIISFFFLSCFCWMTIMGFRMWRSFRKIVKHERISKRRENIILIRCCVFAWGFPALLSTFTVVIDQVDLTSVPWFIKPNILKKCFLSGKEKMLYFYAPITILLFVNYIFFFATACNFWNLYGNPDVLNKESKLKGIKNRLKVVIKISLLMGISWVLEMISSFYPDYNRIWYILDTYNMLIGVALFVSFVCKKKIWHRLFRRRDELPPDLYMDNREMIRL